MLHRVLAPALLLAVSLDTADARHKRRRRKESTEDGSDHPLDGEPQASDSAAASSS